MLNNISELLSDVVSRCNKLISASIASKKNETPKEDAKSRLKLVLMHDRTNLDPCMLEQMRDEIVEVISRYVEIDKDALDLNLESETNSIALVASIPILRTKKRNTPVVQEIMKSPSKSICTCEGECDCLLDDYELCDADDLCNCEEECCCDDECSCGCDETCNCNNSEECGCGEDCGCECENGEECDCTCENECLAEEKECICGCSEEVAEIIADVSSKVNPKTTK